MYGTYVYIPVNMLMTQQMAYIITLILHHYTKCHLKIHTYVCSLCTYVQPLVVTYHHLSLRNTLALQENVLNGLKKQFHYFSCLLATNTPYHWVSYCIHTFYVRTPILINCLYTLSMIISNNNSDDDMHWSHVWHQRIVTYVHAVGKVVVESVFGQLKEMHLVVMMDVVWSISCCCLYKRIRS